MTTQKPIFSCDLFASSLAFSFNKNGYLAAFNDKQITVLDGKSGAVVYKPKEETSQYMYPGMGTIAFSPTDTSFLAGYQALSRSYYSYEPDPTFVIMIWDVTNKKKVFEIFGHTAAGSCLCFSSDGKYLLSGDGVGELIIIDMKKQIKVGQFKIGNGNQIASIQFINDCCFFICSIDGSISSWELIDKLEEHDDVQNVFHNLN